MNENILGIYTRRIAFIIRIGVAHFESEKNNTAYSDFFVGFYFNACNILILLAGRNQKYLDFYDSF